jgi:hypothetical protein
MNERLPLLAFSSRELLDQRGDFLEPGADFAFGFLDLLGGRAFVDRVLIPSLTCMHD